MQNIQDILGDEIGRGAFGTVYMIQNDQSRCVKVSNKKNTSCRQWSNEYRKIQNILDKVNNVPVYKNLHNVCILQPINFIESDDVCYMVMPRIFRPEGKQFIKPTIQAQFGVKTCSLLSKGRGEFIGLREIEHYIENSIGKHVRIREQMEILVYELGIMMGLIHHHARNNGNDIELLLGKELGSKQIKVYIADFDLTEDIEQIDDQTIKDLTWSLDAMPYFPRRSVDEHLFTLFYNGYLQTSLLAGVSKELVDRIFEEYD